MPRRKHYSPCIDRMIVCALYHEGRRIRRPMTRLANEMLTHALRDTPGWSIAAAQMTSQPQGGTAHACGQR
jgi:hypothetical protein